MMKFSSCVLGVLALLNRAEAASECCPNGFKGDDCKTEPTPCEPNPCKNGGECVPHFNTVECKCKPGYSGYRCMIDETCIPVSCLNGVCEAGNCTCTPGFFGELCDQYNISSSCVRTFGDGNVDTWNTFDEFNATRKAVTKIKVFFFEGRPNHRLAGIEAWYGDDVSVLGGQNDTSGAIVGECALSPGEYITEVKYFVATVVNDGDMVGNLEFVTNVKTCGPFGGGEGTMTSIKENNVISFSGADDRFYMNTLSVTFLDCPEE